MPGTPSAWVEFPLFRQYEATRQEANNAMIALLAGAKMAAHTLQLTTGSSALLPDIFPGIDHIGYFRLRTDAATQLLLDTPQHLGAVAVPYALAVHEEFVISCLNLVQGFGYICKAPGKSADATKNAVQAWNMHEAMYLTLGKSPPPRGSTPLQLEHFHLLREMRNSHIHGGGTASARLLQEIADISAPAAAEWDRLARRPPGSVVSPDGVVRFALFDIFTAFATTKALGRAINRLLRDNLMRNEWARVCVDDYAERSSKALHSDQWMQGLVGYASQFYGPVSLTEVELVTGAIEAGVWPPGRPFVQRRSVRLARRKRDPGSRHP